MKISGWGRYPVIEAATHDARIAHRPYGESIARGLGRSYGDAALSEHVLCTDRMNRILAFNENTGEISCEAGVTLAEIIEIFLPRGWFLPVTPGTKFVSVGGAVASDVHGKNHHRDGCFSAFVSRLTLKMPDGSVISCGPLENAALFHATCGGMGLTGLILEVSFRLIRVPGGKISQRTLRAESLTDVMQLFEAHASSTYSVAWIDCLAKGRQRGRSLLYLGEHCEGSYEKAQSIPWKRMPIDAPSFALNTWTLRAFNALYYSSGSRRAGVSVIDIEPFFYPLDSVLDWNRLYGKRGFFQYQCVIPLDASHEAFEHMLKIIAERGKGSFLAVLKRLGPQNRNLLSFPIEGYTLALDFPNDVRSLDVMTELDRVVADHGGRLYLAKDARMPLDLFRSGYPQWSEFVAMREQMGLKGKVESMLSKRLEI